MKDKLKNWLLSPEVLFLLFAAAFGFILNFIIPPLGGNDEQFHYHRIASIAYFQLLNKPVEVPSGIIRFLQSGRDTFYSGMQPPFGYSLGKWRQMADIPLDSAHMRTLFPNFMTFHDPFAYFPEAVAFRLGAVAGLSPLILLYIARAAGLSAGIFFTFWAIRIIPSHKYALAALALLPVITVIRSFLNADIVTNSLAFLFIALAWRESLRTDTFTGRSLLLLTAVGFVMAQCKSPYLLLLLLTFAIPAQRFSSVAARVAALGTIILPAAIASVAWMVVMKKTFFAGASYHTWAGDAYPDMQTAFILQHPLDFAGLLFRNIFLTPLLPMVALDTFSNIGPGKPLPLSIIGILMYGVGASILSGKGRDVMDYSLTMRFLCAVIFVAVIPVMLTMIYIHWNGVRNQEILGSQGRYFYPILPLLLPFARPSGNKLVSWQPDAYVILVAGTGLVSAVLAIIQNYY